MAARALRVGIGHIIQALYPHCNRLGVNRMFKMLIDTCVWLDLAKDQRQMPVLGVVEEMVKRDMITLIVPQVVLTEFRRNRERVAKESARSLSTHFRLVKDAVGKIGGNKKLSALRWVMGDEWDMLDT
jgi:hypothetical protein